jgi:hypothetical protein
MVWKIYYGQIEVVSFLIKLTIGVKFGVNVKNETGNAVFVVSFTSRFLGIYKWLPSSKVPTFSAGENINYRLPIKVYYRIYTLRHIRIEINHGSQNVF